MLITLKDDLPNSKQFFDLYQTTGWKHPFTKERLFQAISNSWYSVSAYKEDELVGFGRVISDGVYQALICDLIVSSKYQGKGIGTRILCRLLDQCKENDVLLVMLFSAKGKFSYYERFGFVQHSPDAPGMIWDKTKYV